MVIKYLFQVISQHDTLPLYLDSLLWKNLYGESQYNIGTTQIKRRVVTPAYYLSWVEISPLSLLCLQKKSSACYHQHNTLNPIPLISLPHLCILPKKLWHLKEYSQMCSYCSFDQKIYQPWYQKGKETNLIGKFTDTFTVYGNFTDQPVFDKSWVDTQ